MLKYAKYTFGRTSTWWRMPFAASSGCSLPLTSAWSANSGGSMIEEVDLAVEEREPARLRLLDDADLDARHERQALALERGRDRLRRGRNRSRRRVRDLAVTGIGEQLDA